MIERERERENQVEGQRSIREKTKEMDRKRRTEYKCPLHNIYFKCFYSFVVLAIEAAAHPWEPLFVPDNRYIFTFDEKPLISRCIPFTPLLLLIQSPPTPPPPPSIYIARMKPDNVFISLHSSSPILFCLFIEPPS